MNAAQHFRKSFNNPFIPLKHRNFRYYWIGMCVSLIGTWMQSVAQPWLAYSLTGSAFLLGLVGALQYLPMLFLSLLAGVLVDRLSTKRIIIFTQAGSLLITLVLALLAFSGQIRYWHILVLATLLGLVNALDMPARQSFVIELVGKEDLMNAIALNSVAFNTARIVGPAIAGLLMGYYGAGVCFLLNSLSFAAVLVSLFFIKLAPFQRAAIHSKNILAEIKAGLGFVYHHRIVLESVILLGIIGTFALNNNVLVPVFNQEVLNQGAKSLGFLLSMTGGGALIGSILVAAMSQSGPQRWIIYSVPLIIGMLLTLNSFSLTFWQTGLCLATTGLFFNLFSSTVNSTIQLNTADEYRGRVMSLYTLVFVGSTPVGNLYAGWSAEYLGAKYGFAACGVMVLFWLLIYYISNIVGRRRVHEQN